MHDLCAYVWFVWVCGICVICVEYVWGMWSVWDICGVYGIYDLCRVCKICVGYMRYVGSVWRVWGMCDLCGVCDLCVICEIYAVHGLMWQLGGIWCHGACMLWCCSLPKQTTSLPLHVHSHSDACLPTHSKLHQFSTACQQSAGSSCWGGGGEAKIQACLPKQLLSRGGQSPPTYQPTTLYCSILHILVFIPETSTDPRTCALQYLFANLISNQITYFWQLGDDPPIPLPPLFRLIYTCI